MGALIGDTQHPLLLITPEGREEETITRLSRVGFDQSLGYLKGGFEAWKNAGKEFDTISSVSAEDFADSFDPNTTPVFDVRKEGEYLSEHVEKASNTPLDHLNDLLKDFPYHGTFYVHCAGGYRSVIAASLLKKRGIHNMIDVQGGFKAIKNTSIPVSEYICPSTL